MNGAEFAAWREGAGLTQAEAGALVGGFSRKTVIRWEGARDKPIPDKAAREVQATGGAPVIAKAAAAKKKATAKGGCPEGCPPAIHEALKRSPLFSLTAAEGKAMRQELSRRGLPTPMIPLEPVWQEVRNARGGVVRKVNAAIPDPVDAPAPGGWGFVMTASGAVYDYYTARRVTGQA